MARLSRYRPLILTAALVPALFVVAPSPTMAACGPITRTFAVVEQGVTSTVRGDYNITINTCNWTATKNWDQCGASWFFPVLKITVTWCDWIRVAGGYDIGFNYRMEGIGWSRDCWARRLIRPINGPLQTEPTRYGCV
jgi:hypothetical protein